jgi:hypothetical protein
VRPYTAERFLRSHVPFDKAPVNAGRCRVQKIRQRLFAAFVHGAYDLKAVSTEWDGRWSAGTVTETFFFLDFDGRRSVTVMS